MSSACRASSSSRGSSPYIPATSLPWSPIHSWPLVSNGHSAGSATSLGRGGQQAPSRHPPTNPRGAALARDLLGVTGRVRAGVPSRLGTFRSHHGGGAEPP